MTKALSVLKFCLVLVSVIVITFSALGVHPVSADTIITDCTNPGVETALKGAVAAGGIVKIDCDGVIELTTSGLSQFSAITPVTVTGEGHQVTIARSALATFNGVVWIGAGKDVTFEHLTIANGSSGLSYIGGAVGVENGAKFTARDVTFTNNTNTLGSGGAIINTGTLTIINSTFNNNWTTGGTADSGGGAIYNAWDAVATITNSTFYNNVSVTANGDAIYNAGGGVAGKGTLALKNSIIAKSADSAHSNCYSGDVNRATYITNLSSGETSGTITCGGPTSASTLVDIFGPAPAPTLAYNNGGDTQTFALPYTSTAINAATPSACPEDDQNKVLRPSTKCDVGSYEFMGNVGNTLSVTLTASTASGVYDGDMRLTAAISPASTGTVEFYDNVVKPRVLVGTATLSASQVTFNLPSAKTKVGSHSYYAMFVSDTNNDSGLSAGTVSLTVTPKNLNITGVTVSSKVYDGTTIAPLNISSANPVGVASGDVVNLVKTSVQGTFANKNVGTGKTVTINGFTIDGADAGNYTLSQPPSLTADITIKTLTVLNAKANNRDYDSTTVAGLDLSTASLSGLATIDQGIVTLNTSSAGGTFANKNAGVNKSVTITGLSLSGNTLGNYTLTQPAATATIAPKVLQVYGVRVNDKVYDGTTDATLDFTNAVLAYPFDGDSVNLITGAAKATFANKNVGGGKAITVTGLVITGADVDLGNYSLVQPSFLTAKITAKPVTVSGITANNKTYNRSTAAALNTGSAALVDKVTGDSVNLITTGAAGAFSDWNVGTGKPVTITGVTITGTDAANYSLIQQTGVTANITPKGLTVSGIAANNKVYDRSTAAELNLVGAALVGKETGDTVNLDTSGAAGAFSDWNVGNSKPITVTGVTITGTNMANYSLTQPAGIKANITTKELTVSGVAANNKIYDGTTAATFSFASAQLAGVIGTDVVTLNSGSAAGTFDDKNVGTGKAVTISGLSLDGAEMGNYHLAQPAGLTADITPAVLTVTADNKTRLEGDANPPLTVTVTGFVNGELATDIISGEPVLSTTAVISSLKGDYDIVIENAGTLQAPNYTFNFVKGILTITRELRFKSYLPAITRTR